MLYICRSPQQLWIRDKPNSLLCHFRFCASSAFVSCAMANHQSSYDDQALELKKMDTTRPPPSYEPGKRGSGLSTLTTTCSQIGKVRVSGFAVRHTLFRISVPSG